MSDPIIIHPVRNIDPVHEEPQESQARWTNILSVFLRVMAGLSLIKGLYHWALVCGVIAGPAGGFEAHKLPWQTTTVFFAVIDLVPPWVFG